jgi:hypothetical protein
MTASEGPVEDVEQGVDEEPLNAVADRIEEARQAADHVAGQENVSPEEQQSATEAAESESDGEP